jgi:ZIP family zinc transporter
MMDRLDWFAELHPIVQAFLATLFTWFVTALGAAPVLFTARLSQRFLDTMLGIAAGVMIAASYWSLLAPAIEIGDRLSGVGWLPAATGFLAGGAFLWLADKVLPHLHPGAPAEGTEGIRTSWERSTLLVLAITLHNIPEGLAVGVAFGAVALGLPEATFGAAVALALGIALQNFPEGTAVAMPLRREGMGPARSFMYGQASGSVEPLAAILGAGLVLLVQPLLPYALAFAAGAMIFVVAEELIPEAQRKGGTDLPTIGLMIGFTIMMCLDVALG